MIMHEFVSRGATIRYRRAGAGRPLLFLDSEESHGESGPFLDALAENFDVIAPDHPGFGASDTPDWFKGVGDIVYFYLDFMRALDLKGVHLAGASLGGWIAAEIAVRDSSSLASVHLLAPMGARLKGTPFGEIFMWTPEENLRNRFHDEALVGRLLARLRARTHEEATAYLRDRYATARLGWHPRLYNPELQRWLHRVDKPLQLLWGDEDKVVPLALANVWREAIPGARLSTFERCGHLPHVERATDVAGMITSFAREVAP